MRTFNLVRLGLGLGTLVSVVNCGGTSDPATDCVPGSMDCGMVSQEVSNAGAGPAEAGAASVDAAGSSNSAPTAIAGANAVVGGAASSGVGSTGAVGETGSAMPPMTSVMGGTAPVLSGGAGSASDPQAGTPGLTGGTGSDPVEMGGTTGEQAGNGTVVEPGPDVDANGKLNASPGDETTVSRDYLRLGDFRILNNRWGSDERGCDTGLKVFVGQDRMLGWDINRGACGGGGAQPDFPEIEFGIHPFGIGNVLETSPPFSSTTLLPLQIKDFTSASINVENLNIDLRSEHAWNISFEFWLSERNPVTDPNPGSHTEVIVFWGWQVIDGVHRWPCDIDGNVQSAGKNYRLCHKVDDWADGQWRYFQLRWEEGGPTRNFSGAVDMKAFMDWLVNTYDYSPDLWVTRFEVGSEIDDNTSATVTLSDINFEVNGTTKYVELSE